jgi:acyl-coenzyme A thioesterase PaaI-like protein
MQAKQTVAPGGESPAREAASQETLARLGAREHRRCLLCGASHPGGLRLAFAVQPDGAVEAAVPGRAFLEGYPGILHGGAIAALLDAAMTNALFARGLVGLTAELTVRFLAPVRLDRPALVRATLTGTRVRQPYCLQAELEQDGQRVAHATGKFLAKPSRGSGAPEP